MVRQYDCRKAGSDQRPIYLRTAGTYYPCYGKRNDLTEMPKGKAK